jgi:cytochrome P450
LLARGNLVEALRRLFKARGCKTLLLRVGPLRASVTVDLREAQRILVTEPARHPKTRWEAGVLEPAMEGGLIILAGEEWERHHRAVAPCFGAAAMARLVTAVSSVARTRMSRFGPIVDVGHEMRCIVNAVMFRFFLDGLDLDEADGAGALDRYSRLFERVERGLETRVVDRLFLRERLRALLRPAHGFWLALRQVTRPIRRALQGKCPVEGSDETLDVLLRHLTAEEATKEIRTLFGAGATTGHLLSWICDLLARHPAVQHRLRSEILEQVGAVAEPPVSVLEAIPLLTAVIQEGLRLYPPAPFLLRKDRTGSLRFISVLGMHRDPDFWDRPDDFDPERWTEPVDGQPRLRSPPPGPFIPFGLGPRACIGKRFAMLEARAILVEILRRFELAPADARRSPEPVATILTRPRRPVRVRLSPAA